MWTFMKIVPHVVICGYVWCENLLRLVLENIDFRLCGKHRKNTNGPQTNVVDGSVQEAPCFLCLLGVESGKLCCGCKTRTDYPLMLCILSTLRLLYWCIIHIEHAMIVDPFSDKIYAEFICDLLYASSLIVVMSLACSTKAILWFLLQGFIISVSVALNTGLLEQLSDTVEAASNSSTNPGYWARWIVQPCVHIIMLCIGVCVTHICCAKQKTRSSRSRGVIDRIGVQREDVQGYHLLQREKLHARIAFRVLILLLDFIFILRCVDVLYILNSDTMHALLDIGLTLLLLMLHFQESVDKQSKQTRYLRQELELTENKGASYAPA